MARPCQRLRCPRPVCLYDDGAAFGWRPLQAPRAAKPRRALVSGEVVYDNSTGYYGYDAVGNRRSRSVSPALQTAGIGDFNNLSLFNVDDRLTSSSYDNNGNTTVEALPTIPALPAPVSPNADHLDQYDFENHLVTRSDGTTTIQMAYDGDGNRMMRAVTGASPETRYYLVDDRNPSGYAQVFEELVADGAGNLFLSRVYNCGHSLVSEALWNGTSWELHYCGYDGHGSVRFLMGSDGTMQNTYTYDAFGILISQTGSTPNNYLYSGEQFDFDLGEYYLRARYYNPNTGRLWTMDTLDGQDEQPSSLHRYTYSRNDPINTCDPSGNEDLAAIVDAVGDQYKLAPGDRNALKARVARSTTIRSRSLAYAEYDQRLQEDYGAIPSLWFKAASIVTGRNAFGAADKDAFNFGLLGNDAADYLFQINQELFVWNTANFFKLDQGQEIPGLEGLRGKRLDYGLVTFEQRKVEAYTTSYFAGKSPDIKSRIVSKINFLIGSKLGADIINQAFQDRFTDKGKKFSFDRENDRVQLGDGIIDLLYNERD